MMKTLAHSTLIAFVLLLVTGCSQEPAKIHYGSDECAHCKMMITDDRFAAQMVTSTGKAVKFDAIECMANYVDEQRPDRETAKFWVSDFNNPGTWVNLSHATLIKSEVIKSPMGANLLALESEKTVRKHLQEYPGERISWNKLVL